MKLKISAIVVLIGLSLSALGLGRLLNREEPILCSGRKVVFYAGNEEETPKFWTCTGVVSIDNRNSINETETMQGLQYHLLCQSLAGLTNRMVEEGKSDVAVWLYDHGGKASYKVSKQALEDMGICEQGVQNGLELACSDYESVDGLRLQLKDFL